MAKRAAEPVTGHNEVVELNNDARWQARLDEARARRAEALKQQGLEDRPKRIPRKPWEEEAETSLAAKEHQRALDDDGLDFHDRMNALQKVLKDKRPEPVDPRSVAVPPVPDHARNWSSEAEQLPTTPAIEPEVEAASIAVTSPVVKPVKTGPPIDSLFDDPRFLAPDPKPNTPLDRELEFVRISDLGSRGPHLACAAKDQTPPVAEGCKRAKHDSHIIRRGRAVCACTFKGQARRHAVLFRCRSCGSGGNAFLYSFAPDVARPRCFGDARVWPAASIGDHRCNGRSPGPDPIWGVRADLKLGTAWPAGFERSTPASILKDVSGDCHSAFVRDFRDA